jgi:DNA-binding IscR family transcriptional regulator
MEIKEVLDAVRTANEMPNSNLKDIPAESVVDQVINDLEQAVAKQLQGLTIKEFALTEGPKVDLVSQTCGALKAYSDESQ